MTHYITRISLTLLVPAALAAQDWTLNPAAGPSARQLPRMVYDLPRAQTVLFGGYDTAAGAANAETWLFDGTAWTQAAPVTSPPPLDTFAMAFDAGRSVTTVFGGVDSNNFPASITDATWEWDGTNWTVRAPAAAPSPRFAAEMAYDQVRAVTVLFGGSTTGGSQSDTWEWDGSNWTAVATATTPPARGNHTMVFDISRGTVVMFGGSAGASQLGDTWEFDGVDWAMIDSQVSPPARTGAGMAYDFIGGSTVLFAGRGPAPISDTWELRDGQWHEFQMTTSPGDRVNIAMTYDVVRQQVVAFGGAPGTLADTWEFGGMSPSYAAYGSGCAGSAGIPTLTATSLPAIGGSLNLTLSNLPSPGFGFLAGSENSANLMVPGTSCDLLILPPAATLGAAAPSGSTTFSVPIPNNTTLQGIAFYFQGISLDAVNSLGLTFSNAGRAVLN